MKLKEGLLTLEEEDMKEIFSLFSSPTKLEKAAVYQEDSDHYFARVELADEYELCQEKKEYALDSWRAVTAFLNIHGYSLLKKGEVFDLSRCDDMFL